MYPQAKAGFIIGLWRTDCIYCTVADGVRGGGVLCISVCRDDDLVGLDGGTSTDTC